MISLLIPVYNFVVIELVQNLQTQLMACTQNFEIIVADDKSDQVFKEKNKSITEIKFCKYVELPENIGRSKIRNLLAETAIYENLIFIDCDMFPVDINFIKTYLQYSNNQVVCGGHTYKTTTDKNYFLHYFYGIRKECKPLHIRLLKPHNSFKSSNFMIKKEIFQKIRFNELFTKYGHEDTFFGYQLLQNNIPIVHINNPLYHNGIETNETFLKKTETAVENLKWLYCNYKSENNLIDGIQILKIYNFLQKFKVSFLFRFVIIFLHKPLKFILINKIQSLFLLDLYKLLYICSIK